MPSLISLKSGHVESIGDKRQTATLYSANQLQQKHTPNQTSHTPQLASSRVLVPAELLGIGTPMAMTVVPALIFTTVAMLVAIVCLNRGTCVHGSQPVVLSMKN